MDFFIGEWKEGIQVEILHKRGKMNLIIPKDSYYELYRSAIDECAVHGVNTYSFLNLEREALFRYYENFRCGNSLPKDYVNATYLWLIDGGEFVGEISIRHALTPSLMRFGGNMGYCVRPSQWNKGVGTKMLGLALLYAKKELDLSKILITCNDDNRGSARVIEKNGGFLENKIVNVIDGSSRVTRRYWIYL